MAKRSIESIRLSAFDDFFQTNESCEDLKRERLMDIPVKSIHDFPDLKDDESMIDLMKSVKTYGLLHLVLVHLFDDRAYETI